MENEVKRNRKIMNALAKASREWHEGHEADWESSKSWSFDDSAELRALRVQLDRLKEEKDEELSL